MMHQVNNTFCTSNVIGFFALITVYYINTKYSAKRTIVILLTYITFITTIELKYISYISLNRIYYYHIIIKNIIHRVQYFKY